MKNLKPEPNVTNLIAAARPLPYAWKITKDYDPTAGAPAGTTYNAAGMIGPADATLEAVDALLKAGVNTWKFRMSDDDNEVYYEGMLYSSDGCQGFEPLDDFGEPNAGCTNIEFLEEGHWVRL